MILDDIVANKRLELAARRKERSLGDVRAAAEHAPAPRNFAAALRASGLSIIAEVKRRSPAKGALKLNVVPADQAALYEGAGARAISVLTDERYFGGRNEDLVTVRERVGLPVLRKDFTIDEYHVWEARSIGADAVLLIVGALDQGQLTAFRQLAGELGMAALVEVHTDQELDRALQAGAALLGVNNRDLTTMTVDLRTTLRLRPRVPDGITFISESGIAAPDDVRMVSSCGIDAILVGEALMSAGDPAEAVRRLLDASAVPAPSGSGR